MKFYMLSIYKQAHKKIVDYILNFMTRLKCSYKHFTKWKVKRSITDNNMYQVQQLQMKEGIDYTPDSRELERLGCCVERRCSN